MKPACYVLIALFACMNRLSAQKDSAGSAEKPFQFTFITPLGTNGINAINLSNRLSLNLLAGVAKGLNGFEAGGIANVILKDAKGVQVAGVTNVVLGNVAGAQFATYLNFSGKKLHGVSFAGFTNLNMDTLEGGQFAAGFNFNKNGGRGIQVAGHSNVTLGDFKGVQISTFANVATASVDGAQIGVFMNYAKKVKGVQIGIVNIADSVDGASIGLFNFVKHGKHQLELFADELFYANVAFRTGTDAFYNIYTAGFQPGAEHQSWHLGYGVGTSIKHRNKWSSDFNAFVHHVNTGNFYFGTSELIKLYYGVEYKVAKKIAIAAGPTLNFFISDILLSDYETVRKNLVPYHHFDYNNRYDFNIKAWLGGRIALRFF